MSVFSVIVPVFNAEKTIERCVQSIVDSGQEDVEVILVDDCSKDGSLQICQRLAKQYKQIKVVKNDMNRGVSFTRNVGLSQATGKYLLFVDSDDYVEQDYVRSFKRTITCGTDLVVCGYYELNAEQKEHCKEIVFSTDSDLKILSLQSFFDLVGEKMLLPQLWNKMFVTKNVKEKNITFDESISFGEDTRFILDYIQRNNLNEVAVLNSPLYYYIKSRKGSLTNRVGYEKVEELLINERKVCEILGKSEEETKEILVAKRHALIYNYSYWIMHNAGMAMREKKRLIYRLDCNQGKELYKKQKKMYYKEKLAAWLKNIRHKK